MCFDVDPDFKDHDPHGIQDHIKVQFNDILAEPEGVHSCDCVWQGTECCFSFMLSLCYGLPVAFCHVFLSAWWGFEFAYLLCVHVWVVTPCLHCLESLLYIPANCYRLCTRCLMDPWFEACAYIFMFFERPPQHMLHNNADRPPRDKHVRLPLSVF